MIGVPVATPPMSVARAREIAESFDLRALPGDFYANPYPVYDQLRSTEPVKQLPDGSWFLTRHRDLMAVYRDASTFSSDKKVEFGLKYNHALKKTPGRSQVFLHPLGGPGEARAGGALNHALPCTVATDVA